MSTRETALIDFGKARDAGPEGGPRNWATLETDEQVSGRKSGWA